MSSFVIVEPNIGYAGVPVSKTEAITTRLCGSTNGTVTDYPFRMGVHVRAVDMQTGSTNCGAGVFQMAQGGGTAISRGQVGMLIGNGVIPLDVANTASKFPLCVAAADISATNICGWVQVKGLCDYGYGTNSDLAAGKPLYVNTDSAGYVRSNVTAGMQVFGMVAYTSATSALSAGSCSYQLNYPQIIGLSASV